MTETRRRRRVALLAVLLCTLGAAPLASASPPDAEQRSRTLYREAEALANNANWPDACPLFQAAHDLHGTGGTALRAADCYEKIGKYDRALELYQYIVDHRDSDKNPDRVTLAERRVAALKKQLGPDQPPPPRPPSLPPVVPPPPNTSPVAPPLRPPNRVPAYAMFGVAGVGLVVGAVFGGLALAQAGDVKAMCPPNVLCPMGRDAKSAAETKAWVSNVGFGVAVVGAAVGVALFITSSPKAAAAVRSAVGPGGLTLRL
jgi:hypothetical protein